MPYRWMWMVCVMVGSVSTLNAMWIFADMANVLMAVPNLISLLILAPVIVSEIKKHLWDDTEAAAESESTKCEVEVG